MLLLRRPRKAGTMPYKKLMKFSSNPLDSLSEIESHVRGKRVILNPTEINPYAPYHQIYLKAAPQFLFKAAGSLTGGPAQTPTAIGQKGTMSSRQKEGCFSPLVNDSLASALWH